MGESKEYYLDEIYQFSSGLSKPADQFGFGYPFLSFKEVFKNYFLPRQLAQLVNSTENERKSGSIRRGDVFITRTSETDDDLGMTSVALKDYPDATFNGFTKRMRPNGTAEILPEFAGYYFRAKRFQAEIAGMSSVTTRASLNNGMLAALRMKLPSFPEQKAIAEVLSSLDDKIDLLRRQNKTLESLAQTLFRQWFIEEAGDSWEERGLDGIAEFLNGLACQKYPQKVGEVGLPVIKIKELRTGITDSSDIATVDVPEKYLVDDGDILFSWSGSLEVVIWSGGKGVLNQHLFKVTSDEFPQWFYYFWIKQHLIDFRGVAEDKATTMGHIQRHHLTNAPVLVPSHEELSIFSATIDPIFQKIKANHSQSISLTKLRDALLTKLMSGDAQVNY